ncbi:MAG: S-layer homology domain-containing protein [Clostridia bacterium]|nr:S-layer homology domain-containing protein [Clostridia bacterium]
MKKTALFLAVVMMSQTISSAVFADFKDMTGHWSERFVDILDEKGIIDGDENGKFRPDEYVKTDEFIKLVTKATGFTGDYESGYWAQPYINEAYDKEYIYDDEFSSFSDNITRGEAAMILVRALGLENSNIPNKESVIREISDYYDTTNDFKGYVLSAYANNLMKGYEDKSFRYKNPLTRGECAVIIVRMLKIKPLEGDTAPDIDTDNIYYVSTDGSDSNDGSFDKPFATIEKAKKTVRQAVINGTYPEEGITIYLREGAYYINETLNFDSYDSGTESAPVRYTAYNNEDVRLTGGVTIPYEAFEPVSSDVPLLSSDAKKHVLQADLKALGIDDYGELSRRGYLIAAGVKPQCELYVDRERMQLSRWPNDNWAGTSSIIRSGARSKSGVLEGAEFTIDYDRPMSWTYSKDIYTSGVLGPNYFYGYFPIEKIEKGKITLKEGSVTEYYSKHFIRYENILEETDMPGEYYIDRDKGMLYYYPVDGFSKDSDITLSMFTDAIISMTGTSNIEFSNILIDSTRGTAISASGVENVAIRNCEIADVGGFAVNLKGTNCKISSNYIHDTGSTAVSVGGGDYDKLISSGNIVENNHIRKPAQLERSYNAGITLAYQSVGTIVRNNEIHDAPHTAMIIYGPEHLIEYNNIYDAVKEFHDMDAIYMNVYIYPWERGVTIRQNYIHDLGQQNFTEQQMNVAGIRTDNRGNGLNIIENVFYNIGKSNSNGVRAICAEGIENVIENNIFIDVAEAYDGPDTYSPGSTWNMEDATVKSTYNDWLRFKDVYSVKYPEILDFFDKYPASYEKSNKFNKNVLVNISTSLSSTNAEPNKYGYRGNENLIEAENNLLTKKDIGFEDYKNKNFTLTDNSEVYTQIPDFKKVEFEKMGTDGVVGRILE